MGTNCAPLIADLSLFCYERGSMLFLSGNNQADAVEHLTFASRSPNDLLNIDKPYFERMVSQNYPTKLQFNKANSLLLKHPFWTWTCP